MATTRLIGPTRSAAAESAPSLLRAWLLAYATIWTFTLAASAIVYAVPGGPALARQLLALKLTAVHNPSSQAGHMLSIAVNNTLHAIWPLTLGIIGAQRHRVSRRLADGAVTANLIMSGLLVGGALGGYGLRVLPYLPHVPVEWAGIALGTSGWLSVRRDRMRATDATLLGATAAGVLLCAAVIETWATSC